MGSYVGLDIGEKRIGVALCDESAPFPAPLTTLEANPALSHEFAHILKQNAVRAVVVGLPRNQQGERTKQTERVEKIVQLLKIPKSIPVFWQDESLTSVKAEEELRSRKKHFAKGDIDALAATYILNDFVHTQLPGVQSLKKTDHADIDSLKVELQTSSVKPHKVKQHKKKRAPKLILLGSLIAVLVLASALFGWYIQSTSPISSEDQYSVVAVESGSGTQAIAQKLEEKGLIKNATAFTLYVRLHGITNLQAGSYRLSTKQSVAEIAKVLYEGKVTTVDVLIPPGLRLQQITAILQKEGYSEQEINAALEAVRNHPLLASVPKNARLEGYLFPDTYQIDPTTSAQTLVRLMLDTLENKITPDLRAGIKAQGLTLDQAIILASIVQKEVSDPRVQKTVAQVFITRLKAGMVLGSDVTYKYAASQFGAVDSPTSDSPYNTRKYAGLPPTAIANFNMSALRAVANPTDTDYVYFVAGDDGITHFARTQAEHEANVQKYCTKLCQ